MVRNVGPLFRRRKQVEQTPHTLKNYSFRYHDTSDEAPPHICFLSLISCRSLPLSAYKNITADVVMRPQRERSLLRPGSHTSCYRHVHNYSDTTPMPDNFLLYHWAGRSGLHFIRFWSLFSLNYEGDFAVLLYMTHGQTLSAVNAGIRNGPRRLQPRAEELPDEKQAFPNLTMGWVAVHNVFIISALMLGSLG